MLNHRKKHLGDNEDVWEIIGGGIEDGELPHQAIKREVEEELHYEVNEDQDALEVDREFLFINRDVEFEIYFFKAKFPGIEVFADSDEVRVRDLRLFSLREALGLPLLPIAKKILSDWDVEKKDT